VAGCVSSVCGAEKMMGWPACWASPEKAITPITKKSDANFNSGGRKSIF